MSLRIDVEVFQSQKGEFLLNMSVLLRTVVLINIKQDGKEDIESAVVSRRKRSMLRFRREAESGYVLTCHTSGLVWVSRIRHNVFKGILKTLVNQVKDISFQAFRSYSP